MEFENGVYDCVLDKGTLDCILCGESSTTNSHKMLSEINRVLNSGGVYIVISYGQPDQRLLYLDKVIILFNILA